MTAHATALLTSLRTIAGAMGSAVFVALFTSISTHSAERYGSLASVHGANMTFLAMAACSVLLLALAFFGTRAAVRAPSSWKHSCPPLFSDVQPSSLSWFSRALLASMRPSTSSS